MIPSPSSSLSVLSGVPSPSVSLNTFTTTVFVTGVSPSWLTVTEIVTLRSSSVSPQLLISGVPTTLPVSSTLSPLTGCDVIVLFGLFGVTTTALVYAAFSFASAGVPTVKSNGFLITFPFNLISGVGSLVPTPAPLCL